MEASEGSRIEQMHDRLSSVEVVGQVGAARLQAEQKFLDAEPGEEVRL